MRSFKVLVLLTLLAAVPILAAEEPPRAAAKPLATMHVTPDAVSWEAVADFGGLELAVAFPGGTILRRQFAPGETPTFALFDEGGQTLADGAYTYELRTAREMRPGRSLLLSGTIGIQDGSFVDLLALGDRPNRGPKPVFETDVVHNDELIVNGNGACIGSGCAAGDADPQAMQGGLRLKSASPQIWFDDTGGGVSGTHDWHIVTNGPFFEDSFKIYEDETATTPFTITGGAPTHSLFVDSSGNVGLGTSAPGVKLHLYGTATSDVVATTGVDPISGPAFNFGYGGASFGRSGGFLNVRADASATAPNPSLRFMTSTVTRVIIDNEGYVGLGSSINPAYPIEQQGTGARLTTAGVWQDGSSRAIKRDIHRLDADDALAALAALEPVRFHYATDASDEYLGFIAEDVPALVATPDRKTLGPMDFVALLTRVVQEQQRTIAALAAKVEELEAKKE